MKAKQHVVLARRRLGMALLAAEKDIANDSFMQPVGESLAANASSKVCARPGHREQYSPSSSGFSVMRDLTLEFWLTEGAGNFNLQPWRVYPHKPRKE